MFVNGEFDKWRIWRCLLFSALTLLGGWPEGHLARPWKPCAAYPPKVLFWNKRVKGRKPRGTADNRGFPGKPAAKADTLVRWQKCATSRRWLVRAPAASSATTTTRQPNAASRSSTAVAVVTTTGSRRWRSVRERAHSSRPPSAVSVKPRLIVEWNH